ncbi:MAG: hypothetical protein OXU69_00120 [Gemmatimonadota bacterium]|nr:hypothetical protein [Gammaproteobacteria bacterium]MDE2983084.1 hypothetical protein [Gemmatimonadota bacterium]
MNDPYVVALLYKFVPEPTVDYSRAEPLNHEEKAFHLTVEGNEARFDMKGQYATKEAAREAVEPFIRRWKFYARLQPVSRSFDLRFDRAHVEDRNPTPGVVAASAAPLSVEVAVGRASGTVHATRYPAPPTVTLAITADVKSACSRYLGYLAGEEPLPSMAYFCITVMKRAARREGVSPTDRFRISRNVLRTAQRLASQMGGSQARKADATEKELSAEESRSLEQAIRFIIQRMAEVAADPDRHYSTITMSDL